MPQQGTAIFRHYGLPVGQPSKINNPQILHPTQPLRNSRIPFRTSGKQLSRPTSQCSTNSMSSRKGLLISSKIKKELHHLYDNQDWPADKKNISPLTINDQREDRRVTRSSGKVTFHYSEKAAKPRISFNLCSSPSPVKPVIRAKFEGNIAKVPDFKIFPKPWNQPLKSVLRSESCKFFTNSSSTEETLNFEEEARKSLIEELTVLEGSLARLHRPEHKQRNQYGI